MPSILALMRTRRGYTGYQAHQTRQIQHRPQTLIPEPKPAFGLTFGRVYNQGYQLPTRGQEPFGNTRYPRPVMTSGIGYHAGPGMVTFDTVGQGILPPEATDPCSASRSAWSLLPVGWANLYGGTSQ